MRAWSCLIEKGVARYSYGEWKWYVEGRQGVWRGVAAMLWPTRSGIGRTQHGDIDSPHSHLDRLAPEGIETIYSLQADAELVIALQQSLDTHFARARMEPVFSEDYGLYFVPYPRDYSALHQSNLVVAQWLRQLDVEVKGSPGSPTGASKPRPDRHRFPRRRLAAAFARPLRYVC